SEKHKIICLSIGLCPETIYDRSCHPKTAGGFFGGSRETIGGIFFFTRNTSKMAFHLLSYTTIPQDKKRQKPYNLHDGGGLYAHIDTNGSKYWRLKFRLAGKERVFSIGVYPEVSLAAARDEALKARQLIRDGLDPVAERKQRRASNGSGETFQEIAEEWM